MLPEDQKTQTSTYFKTSDYNFQTLSEIIGSAFEALIGNEKLNSFFEILSHMSELKHVVELCIQQLFLLALFFFVTIFCVYVSNY